MAQIHLLETAWVEHLWLHF